MKSEKMKKYMICFFLLSFIFFQRNELSAQDRLKFDEGFKPGSHHIELRDLGYQSIDLIPPDESSITSLVEGTDGNIYGGTTGPVCHLFVFIPSLNRVKHLGKISGQESIHHSLVAGEDGVIYIGTGLNEIKQYPISDPLPGNRGIIRALWNDVEKRYSNYKGGHLYKFDFSKEKREWIEPEDDCNVEDLGIPVQNNGIYNMTINNKRKEIYGITYPYGHFFIYDLETEKFTDMGEIYKKKIFGGPNRTLRSISRAIIIDDNDFVYGSADDGVIFRYNPRENKIENLSVKIPSVYYSVVEALVKDENGIIYGGTSEGYLFRFNPEKMKLASIGKPLAQLRIRGLAIGKNGILYGIAGERINHCRIFGYNILEGEFKDLGILKVVREPYYSWTGLQFDAMQAGNDGVIFMGESERRSHLFLFYP